MEFVAGILDLDSEDVVTGEIRVDTTVTISLRMEQINIWCGFILERQDGEKTIVLKGDVWEDTSLRESIVAVLELAECLECENIIVCLEKDRRELSCLVHDFMYIGFELVNPLLQNCLKTDEYVLVGMAL